MGMSFFDVAISGSVTGKFSIEAKNRVANSSSAVSCITIDEVTDFTAYTDTIRVAHNTATSFSLATNSDEAIFAITAQPENGTLSGTAPHLVYTPNTGFRGFDQLIFSATNEAEITSATVTFDVERASFSAVGSLRNYHITGNEAINYRSTGVPKTFDLDGDLNDNVYGSSGYYFFGNGRNADSNTNSTPSWVTNISVDGLRFASSSNYTSFDDPTLPIAGSVNNWNSTTVAVSNSDVATGGIWTQLLSFSVNGNVPPKFRLGIMAGNEGSGDGRWDPSGLRLSFEGGAMVEFNDLEVTNLGMVFVDVELADGITGNFIIEGQTRSLGSNIRGPSIAGITIDEYDSELEAFDSLVELGVDQPAAVELRVSHDSVSYHLDSQPSSGVLSGTPPNLTYTPRAGFLGRDRFSFHVSNSDSTSNVATVEIEIGSVIVRRAGPATGYHAGTVEGQSYRSTNVPKTKDTDGDNIYGTEGSIFSGVGLLADTRSDDPFHSGIITMPSWLSELEAGRGFNRLHGGSNIQSFDNPLEPAGPSVPKTVVTSILIDTNEATNEDRWVEALRFKLLPGAPSGFRIGILAGTGTSRSLPEGIRISYNNQEPVEVTELPDTNLGIVFFDVSMTYQTSGELSVEVLPSVDALTVITMTGVTIDRNEVIPSAYAEWLIDNPSLGGSFADSQLLALGDPDKDGLATIIEYVLNQDPSSIDSNDAIQITSSEQGSVFEFERLAASASDTVQTFQYSMDLSEDSWVDVPLTGAIGNAVKLGPIDNNGMQKVTISMDGLTAEEKVFGRLQVGLPVRP